MKITKNIYAIKIPFEISLSDGRKLSRFVYVYLICSKKIYLIDSGVKGSEKIIFDFIKSINRNPLDIQKVFFTHAHPDHIGSAKSLEKLVGCKFYIHNLERDWVENIDLQSQQRPVPGFHDFVEGPVSIADTFEDEEVVQLDSGLILKVLHTPGHSLGSVSFILPSDKIVFCGDAILPDKGIPIYDNYCSTVVSLNRLSELKDIDFLLSSWSDPTGGREILKLINESKKYLEQIKNLVLEVYGKNRDKDVLDLSKQVLSQLGLPLGLMNPLVVKSFVSILEQNKERN